jgi:hypothetical protein
MQPFDSSFRRALKFPDRVRILPNGLLRGYEQIVEQPPGDKVQEMEAEFGILQRRGFRE